MKTCFYILSVIFLCTGTLLASEATENFASANQFYAEGKFPEAAKTYDAILSGGTVSPNLLFNDGNAHFKSGNLGSAIAAYRRAALLSPRDADVRANLEFARNQVQGATMRQSPWQNWLAELTLNEWTGLTAILFWLTLGLFAAMLIRPGLKSVLSAPARIAVIATIFFGACLGGAISIHYSQPVAVVLSQDAVTRSGPFNDAQNAFAVHDGAELSVLDQRDGWVQVSDGNGRSGWMPDSQIAVLPAI
jgi:tetratricopeptide (TPR) repeat protein